MPSAATATTVATRLAITALSMNAAHPRSSLISMLTLPSRITHSRSTGRGKTTPRMVTTRDADVTNAWRDQRATVQSGGALMGANFDDIPSPNLILRRLAGNEMSRFKHLPHPEERCEAARLEGWATNKVLVPTKPRRLLRGNRDASIRHAPQGEVI